MPFEGKKVEEAADFIRRYIHDNRLKQGERLPTESKVGESTGFSRVTVRRAYSNLLQEGLISSVQGGGYYVNKTPGDGPVRSIPFILSNDDAGIAKSLDISQGAQSFLSAVDLRLTVAVTSGNALHEKQILREFYEEGVRSLILWPFPGTENSSFYFDMMQKGMRIVFVDIKPDISCDFIESDNFTGGFLAAEHLIGMGHKRITAVYHSPIENVSSLKRRYEGYLFAKRRYGISGEDLIISDISRREPALRELFMGEGAPTAIFALNDGMAVAAADFARDNWELIPDGLAVIGFDNSEAAARHSPGISSIAQPFYDIGYEAAKLAYERLTDSGTGFKNYSLPVKLVVRDSTDARISKIGLDR